jgi:hypothetical protein
MLCIGTVAVHRISVFLKPKKTVDFEKDKIYYVSLLVITLQAAQRECVISLCFLYPTVAQEFVLS